MDYKAELLKQRQSIMSNKSLQRYFKFLYSLVSSELGESKEILEVGSGAGVSKLFLKNRIVRTDFLEFPEFGVKGECRMESLPFQNASFEVVLAIDSIHHSAHPLKAIDEFLRVVKNDGRIILIEPYVSLFSYLPFKIFHHEETSWNFKESPLKENNSNVINPAIGDQGVSKLIIETIGNKQRTIRTDLAIQTHYFSPFSFFATGGVLNPLKTPCVLINALIAIESRIPQGMMRYIASRVRIVIEKSN